MKSIQDRIKHYESKDRTFHDDKQLNYYKGKRDTLNLIFGDILEDEFNKIKNS